MSARDRIFSRIAAARRSPTTHTQTSSYATIAHAASDLISLFFNNASRLGSDVTRIHDLEMAPEAISKYIDSHQLPRRAVCWPDLIHLAWNQNNIAVESRGARGDDAIGITNVFAAIAETGTLMLLSGPSTPATVSLLPETHIALVQTQQIVPTMESAWARMRTEHGTTPRAVNFISGPSRTADVEQTVTLGAHGPRRVLIILIDGWSKDACLN